MKNAAILYSGQIRTWESCKANQKENLVANCDLYFYTPEEPSDTEYTQWAQDHTESYYPHPLNTYDSNKNPITQLNGSLCQWHVNFINFCLVPTDYDVYVRSRTDITLSAPINFSDYDYPDDVIYVPSQNDHCGGVNDQFAFGSYQVMKKYFSIYLNHKDLFAKGLVFHTEFYTTENLKAQGVNIIRIPQTNTIVR